MVDTPKHDFRNTELDPDLLSTPFRVQTNWHVITGKRGFQRRHLRRDSRLFLRGFKMSGRRRR